MERVKLEGSELWEIYGPSEKEISRMMQNDLKERNTILDKIQNWIVSNSLALKLFYESEDGRCIATIRDLQLAVDQARTSELKNFLQTGKLFYEDGYILVRVED